MDDDKRYIVYNIINHNIDAFFISSLNKPIFNEYIIICEYKDEDNIVVENLRTKRYTTLYFMIKGKQVKIEYVNCVHIL